MIQEIKKAPKVALCRMCHGTGKVKMGKIFQKSVVCPQCEGSGRVTVSCMMSLDIRPYHANVESGKDE